MIKGQVGLKLIKIRNYLKVNKVLLVVGKPILNIFVD